MSWNNIVKTIKLLEESPSSNEKIKILKDNESEMLWTIVRAALDDGKYYMAKIPEYTNVGLGMPDEEELCNMLNNMELRNLSGKKAKSYVADFLSHLDPKYADIIERIILKDLKCGVNKGLANKAFGKHFIRTQPCMLAKAFNEKNLSKITFPATLQQKMDGARCTISVVDNLQKCQTRNGKTIHIPDFEGLPTGSYVLDGELLHYTDGVLDDRKTGNGLINSALVTPTNDPNFKLVVWDCISWEVFYGHKDSTETYSERWNRMETVIANEPNITAVPSDTIFSLDEASVLFKKYLDLNYEGAIVKNSEHLWTNKRSPDLVKMKDEITSDLKIVDVLEGAGKYENMLGSIVVEDSSGTLRANVGTGFNDDDRQYLWKHKNSLINQIVEVKYNEIIKQKNSHVRSLFLPVFITIRHDKDTVDTL
jgi:ATP-dependent DNA ligase